MTPTLQDKVEQFGVTLLFGCNYTIGQFANGDYWMLGPVELIETIPAFDGLHNGFEINPSSYIQNGFDLRLYGWNASRVPQLYRFDSAF